MRTSKYILIGLLFLFSCGRKTAPEAPEDRAPKPIVDLTVKATKNSIIFNWKAPTQNVKGDEILAIDSFIILRREYRLAQTDDFEEIANIEVKEKKDSYSYTDVNINTAQTYDYIISAVNDEGVSGVQESFARVNFNGEKSTTTVTPFIEEVK